VDVSATDGEGGFLVRHGAAAVLVLLLLSLYHEFQACRRHTFQKLHSMDSTQIMIDMMSSLLLRHVSDHDGRSGGIPYSGIHLGLCLSMRRNVGADENSA